jgi:hypothetical protein
MRNLSNNKRLYDSASRKLYFFLLVLMNSIDEYVFLLNYERKRSMLHGDTINQEDVERAEYIP